MTKCRKTSHILVSSALRRIREEALEEAAKIAEQLNTATGKTGIANAIRALKDRKPLLLNPPPAPTPVKKGGIGS